MKLLKSLACILVLLPASACASFCDCSSRAVALSVHLYSLLANFLSCT